jgi:hypothetical protein
MLLRRAGGCLKDRVRAQIRTMIELMEGAQASA